MMISNLIFINYYLLFILLSLITTKVYALENCKWNNKKGVPCLTVTKTPNTSLYSSKGVNKTVITKQDIRNSGAVDVKSVLDSNAYSSFLGNIIVDKDAIDIKAHLTNKNLLLNRKIKLFSSKTDDNKKISYALLKFIPLKKLLNGNNVTNEVRDIIWDYILLLYVFSELSSKDKGNIDKNLIKQILHSVNDSSKKNSDTTTTENTVKKEVATKTTSNDPKQNILNLDCNKETNKMINDIVGMFQNNLENFRKKLKSFEKF